MRGERGAAALIITVLTAMITVAALVCGVLGGLLADHRRVSAAADLAALAGAAAVQRRQPACAAAGEVALSNGARLGTCSNLGDEVQVEAVLSATLPLGASVELRARARSGPVQQP